MTALIFAPTYTQQFPPSVVYALGTLGFILLALVIVIWLILRLEDKPAKSSDRSAIIQQINRNTIQLELIKHELQDLNAQLSNYDVIFPRTYNTPPKCPDPDEET